MALKTRITVTIDEDLLKDVDRLADVQGRSRSDYIERCIRDQVSDEATTIKLMQNPVVGPAIVRAFSDPEVIKGFAAAIGGKLSEEQLTLFHDTMQQLGQKAATKKKPKRAKGKR